MIMRSSYLFYEFLNLYDDILVYWEDSLFALVQLVNWSSDYLERNQWHFASLDLGVTSYIGFLGITGMFCGNQPMNSGALGH